MQGSVQPQATKSGAHGVQCLWGAALHTLLGSGCQHGAAAAPRAGTSASLAGAEVTPAPILREGHCCSCPPQCCRAGAEHSHGCGVRAGAAALLPRNPGKAGRGGEVPASRNQWFQDVPGTFMALRCQNAQERLMLPL